MKNENRTEVYQEPRMEVVKLSAEEIFTLNVSGGGDHEVEVGPQTQEKNVQSIMGGWNNAW